MENQQIPAWFHEAIQALRWLELKRNAQDETFWSPHDIAVQAKIDQSIVQQMIDSSQDALEEQNGKYRFSATFRIDHRLNQMVADGLVYKDKVSGKYGLTVQGTMYAHHLIATDPKAKEIFDKLLEQE